MISRDVSEGFGKTLRMGFLLFDVWLIGSTIELAFKFNCRDTALCDRATLPIEKLRSMHAYSVSAYYARTGN